LRTFSAHGATDASQPRFEPKSRIGLPSCLGWNAGPLAHSMHKLDLARDADDVMWT